MKCCVIIVVFLAALLWVPSPVEAFIPNGFLSLIARALDSSGQSATTHVAMTRNAILRITVDLLRENPYDEQSQQRINDLGLEFDEADLVRAYYGRKKREVTKKFEAAIEEIEEANCEVDTGKEKKLAEAHFDSEQFQSGQNRLIERREMIVKNIKNQDYTKAREETGRMLHTLQDFYSHSNWIELGNTETYSVLGQPGERPENIAETATCTDCSEDGKVKLNTLYRLGIFLGQSARFHYRCNNNIRSDVLSSHLLTSGYYANQIDSKKQVIEKASGKCSHGGYADPSGDLHAKGGINKDSPYRHWSPHSSQHFEAARLAEQATVNLLNEIRDEIDDDEMFGAYLNLFIKTATSIAYVIDTTGSMSAELPEIQENIPVLRSRLQQYKENLGDNAEINYILVPFNDPDPGYIYESDDIEVFLSGIASLNAEGGFDHPEPSIGALIRAIKASEEGSSVYVFTDAPASDTYRLAEAQALIIEKSVTVRFFFVDRSFRKRSINHEMQSTQFKYKERRQVDDTYSILAAFSGGQVLSVGTSDLSRLGELVSFSVDQSRSTILRESGMVVTPYTFSVDSSIERVIISINGVGFNVSLTTPTGNPASTLNLEQYSVSLQSSSSFIATINITDSSLQGTWQISLPQNTFYDVLVSAISDLSFSSDLLALDPSSNYGFSSVVGKPLNGKPVVAIFQASDRSTSLAVETIQLVDSTGTILQSIDDVFVLDDNAFATNFIPPEGSFHWQIVGQDEEGYEFSRISNTAIEVSDIDLTLGEDETGYYVIRPGSNATVPITLYNSGNEGVFTLNIETLTTHSDLNISAYFKHPVNSSYISVASNSTEEIVIQLFVPENATDGQTSSFTVVARSTLDDSNDFVTFQLAVSSRPPPEFTANDYATPSIQPSSTEGLYVNSIVLWVSVFLMLMEFFLLVQAL